MKRQTINTLILFLFFSFFSHASTFRSLNYSTLRETSEFQKKALSSYSSPRDWTRIENIYLFVLLHTRPGLSPPSHTRYARGIHLIGIHNRDSAMTSTLCHHRRRFFQCGFAMR